MHAVQRDFKPVARWAMAACFLSALALAAAGLFTHADPVWGFFGRSTLPLWIIALLVGGVAAIFGGLGPERCRRCRSELARQVKHYPATAAPVVADALAQGRALPLLELEASASSDASDGVCLTLDYCPGCSGMVMLRAEIIREGKAAELRARHAITGPNVETWYRLIT